MKKKVSAPTAEEMMAAIRDAIGVEPNDPGVTVIEWAAENKMTVSAARGALERGVVSGKLVKGRARRAYTDGRSCLLPVYRRA
jgi:malonyl CoA-acyl carrier protein transacylase